MRLDRRLRDAELIGDLLVQQPLGDHGEHARLLRGQRLQAFDQFGNLLVALHAEFEFVRRPDAAVEHDADGVAQLLEIRRFGDEAGGAEAQGPSHRLAVVTG